MGSFQTASLECLPPLPQTPHSTLAHAAQSPSHTPTTFHAQSAQKNDTNPHDRTGSIPPRTATMKAPARFAPPVQPAKEGPSPTKQVHAVGIDLAWGDAPSGLAWLTGPIPDTSDDGPPAPWRLVETARIGPLEGIAAWITSRIHAEAPLWIAIDAPLVAHNPPGTNREADKNLSAALRPYRVSAFPVNRDTARRGAQLLQLLKPHAVEPAIPRKATPLRRGAFETFPTAAQLHFLELTVPIRYKRGTLALRQENLERFILRLAMMEDPALRLQESGALRELYGAQPRALNGNRLKALEDRIDALLCAFVAALAWNTPERLITYGDETAGSITIPRPPAL